MTTMPRRAAHALEHRQRFEALLVKYQGLPGAESLVALLHAINDRVVNGDFEEAMEMAEVVVQVTGISIVINYEVGAPPSAVIH